MLISSHQCLDIKLVRSMRSAKTRTYFILICFYIGFCYHNVATEKVRRCICIAKQPKSWWLFLVLLVTIYGFSMEIKVLNLSRHPGEHKKPKYMMWWKWLNHSWKSQKDELTHPKKYGFSKKLKIFYWRFRFCFTIQKRNNQSILWWKLKK